VLDNVQYTAFYKFLVSIGLVIVGLGLAVPWLLLHESFDLLVKQTDLSQLTLTAQATIRHRQAIVRLGSLVCPWISLGLFVSGLTISGLGVLQWRRRQLVMDRTEEANLEKVRAETNVLEATPQEATPPERDAKQSKEAWEAIQEGAAATPRESPSTETDMDVDLDSAYRQLRDTIADIDQIAIDKLRSAFASTHDVLAHAKLSGEGQQLLLDAILTPRQPDQPGLIVESEYVSRPESIVNQIFRGSSRLVAARRLYRATAKVIQTVLMFIVADADPSLMDDLKRQLSSLLPESLKVVALNENELRDMPPDELRSRILGSAEPPSTSGRRQVV
jgi:hypothetical protein